MTGPLALDDDGRTVVGRPRALGLVKVKAGLWRTRDGRFEVSGVFRTDDWGRRRREWYLYEPGGSERYMCASLAEARLLIAERMAVP